MVAPTPPNNFRPALLWLIAAAVILHLASAAWHIFFGAMNADEGFYAIGTRSVAQGEMPYRDFGFTQPPLVLYANSLPLRLIGFGLFPQRSLNGLWAAAALALGALWLARRTDAVVGLALVTLFSLTAPWMYFIHLGKTYGFTTFLVMLATWAFLALRSGPGRNFLLGLLAILGVATRLPAGPLFAVLGLLCLWPNRRPTLREVLAALGGAVVGGAVGVAPFWFAAPAATKFWVFDFHRVSVPYKDWRVDWSDLIALAPAVWLLATLAVIIVVVRRRFAARETGVLLASLVTLAANLLPSGTYQEYGIPFLLPLAVGSAALVYDEFKSRARSARVALAAAVIAAQVFVAPLLSLAAAPARAGAMSAWLPPHAPGYDRQLPAHLAAARAVVIRALPPEAPFIGPNIILAAETGRPVPPDLRMGPFSFTVELSPEEATRVHLATHEQLDAWFARRDITLLAFFKRRELNYGWSMPSFDQLKEDFHAQWFAPLRRDFSTAYEGGDDFVLLVRNP